MPYNPEPAAQLPRWLTLQQASVYIGLPVGYLRRLIREGTLPAIDLGKSAIGRWRVSRKDLAGIQGAIHRKP
jgi:excisionase family DNA binding protein